MGNENYRKYFVLQMDLFIVWTIYSMDKIYDIMDYKWSWQWTKKKEQCKNEVNSFTKNG